jgi:hypothetical protein
VTTFNRALVFKKTNPKTMKTITPLLRVLLLPVMICIVLSSVAFASREGSPGVVALEVEKLIQKNVQFSDEPVFEYRGEDAELRSKIGYPHKALYLKGPKGAANRSQFPEFLRTEIPHPVNGQLSLLLYRVDIRSNGFRVITASGMEIDGGDGIAHYRGIIENDMGSVVSMTITNDEVMAVISNDDGNFVIGQLANDEPGKHIIYNDRSIAGLHTYECGTNTSFLANPYPEEALRLEPNAPGTLTTKCVDWYYETDYDIYAGKGSVSAVNTYMQGVFNQVSTLYNNDGISTTLQTLFIWDVTDPYTGTTTSNYLSQFGSYRTSFAGDVAMLVGYNGGGGVAYVNGLCSSSTQYRMGYSAISSTYQNVPTYSWTVEVLTHEGGHLLGSRHTHDCVWNGNNTRIDGCGPAAGYSSGSCAAGPIPVSGTIMSYCHLVSGVGINFNNGFGPLPASLIVNTVNNAACLTACSSPCSVPSNPGAITIGGGSNLICPGNTRTFSIASVSGATSYTWTVPTGATITSGQGSTLINVSFGTSYPSSGNISVVAVNTCGSSGSSSTAVSRSAPAVPSVITGSTTGACSVSGIPYSVIQDAAVTSYTWSFSSTAGTVASGQGTNAITANFGTGSTSVTLSVTAGNSCGTSAARTLSISHIPSVPGSITGTSTPCRNQQGVPYSISPVASATSYRWTVPSGSRIVAGGVTSSNTALVTSFSNVAVNFKTTAGNVSVRANNACGSSSYRSLAVTFPCREISSEDVFSAILSPNPVQEEIKLQINSFADGSVLIQVRDIQGRLLSSQVAETLTGTTDIIIDASTIPNGIYSVTIDGSQGRTVLRMLKI